MGEGVGSQSLLPDGDPTCPICGGSCTAFPDIPVPDDYPFMTEDQKAAVNRTEDQDAKPARRRGKRRPAEDRMVHGPVEDR